jgi:hypothetical protein
LSKFKSHASFWALVLQGWRGVAGLVTVWLTSTILSPIEQGWYYALLTVAGASAIFELGLGTVLVNIAAKIRDQTSLGLPKWPEGSAQGSAFVGASMRCFVAIGFAYLVCIAPFGLWFFSTKPSLQADWTWAWVALCVSSAGTLMVVPFLAIAQVDGKAAGVFRMQLLQAILGSLLCWYLLVNGWRLWACVAMPLTSLLVSWLWLAIHYPRLLRVRLFGAPEHFSWRQKVWPLQWRAASNTVCSYASTQLFVPVLFAIHGAAIAAKFALGLALVNMIGIIGLSWVSAESSRMASIAVLKDWPRLDSVFRRRMLFAIAICFVASGLLIALAVNQYQVLGVSLVDSIRLPSLVVLLCLLGWSFANLLIACLGIHLRAHQREPFVVITLLSTALQIPLIVALTSHQADLGTSSALLFTSVFISLPLAYFAWRKEIGTIRGTCPI